MKTLLTAEQLKTGVAQLAQDINVRFAGEHLTIVGVLSGCVVLLADLIRQMDLPLRVGLVQARSYRGENTQPGELVLNFDFLPDVQGRRLLIVDDIFDTGRTLQRVVERLSEQKPKSIQSAVLLRKQGRGEIAMTPDFVVFEIPDIFVVGYGLDYNDLYRNLPYIAGLDEADLDRPTPGSKRA
jgi:hypoxanthine phosphoribosyltransferase